MSNQVDPTKAVDFIRDNAHAYAQAKSNRVHLEEFRKSKKALLMLGADQSQAVAMREAFAYSHKDYVELLDGLKQAVEIEETIRWKMEAARLRVEVWRTQESTNRVQDKAHR